jgi:CheY-like chemotaxis protein
MTILYVDDDADDREFFMDALRSVDKNIVCHTANNGLDALALLESGNPLPDVIFLDINMPLMNGKMCLGEIKANKALAHLPVIMFTTSDSPREIAECRKKGASNFVSKPVSYLTLTETLTAILNSSNSFSADHAL